MGIEVMAVLKKLLANARIRSSRGGHHQDDIHSFKQTLRLFYIRFICFVVVDVLKIEYIVECI